MGTLIVVVLLCCCACWLICACFSCLFCLVLVSAALNFLRRELKDRSTTFGEEEDGLEGKRLRLE